MKRRIRTYNKLGNGKYCTTSWKVSEYIFVNVLYFIFIYLPFLFIKYCMYIPIKWICVKFYEMIKSKRNIEE